MKKAKFERLKGKIVITIIESLIGVGIICLFFYLVGLLLDWIEQSPLRFITFIIISGIIITKQLIKEIIK